MAVADDLHKKRDEFRDQFGMEDFGSTWKSAKKSLPAGSTRTVITACFSPVNFFRFVGTNCLTVESPLLYS